MHECFSPRRTRHETASSDGFNASMTTVREAAQAKVTAGHRQIRSSIPRPGALPAMRWQHLAKPCNEAEMMEKPHFDAPWYQGSGKGLSTLLSGCDSRLGRPSPARRRRHDIVHREDADTRQSFGTEDGRCASTARQREPSSVRGGCLCRRGACAALAQPAPAVVLGMSPLSVEAP